jgi:hypothetical protein
VVECDVGGEVERVEEGEVCRYYFHAAQHYRQYSPDSTLYPAEGLIVSRYCLVLVEQWWTFFRPSG